MTLGKSLLSVVLGSFLTTGYVFAAPTYISLAPTLINGSIVTSKDKVCDNSKEPYVFTITPEADMTLQGVELSLLGDASLIEYVHVQVTLPGTVAELDFGYTAVDGQDVLEIPLPDTYIRRGVSTTVTVTPLIPCTQEGVYTLSLTDIITDGSDQDVFVEEKNLYSVTTSLRSTPYSYYDTDIRSVFFTSSDLIVKTCLDPLQISNTDEYPTSILKVLNTDVGIAVKTVIDRSVTGAGCKDTTIPLLAVGAGEGGVSHNLQFFIDSDSTNTSYEQLLDDNIKEINHIVQKSSTDSNAAQLTWTEDVKTLGGIVGLSVCNNDATVELPGANPSITIDIENKVNKTTLSKTISLPKNFTQGTCSYAYMHRRELGTVNEGTYRIHVDTDEGVLKEYIITETSEINVTILNSEKDALEIRQDYYIKNFFLKESDITFSLCNEGGKTIIEREPLIALYKGHITDVANSKHAYSFTTSISLGNEECEELELSLESLPDSVFNGGNKLITLAILDQIDEYDFGNNIVQFEANRYEREGVTKPLEEEEKEYNPNPTTQELIDWMYKNGLTKFNTEDEFGPDRLITRGEIAKFFTKFAEILEMKVTKSNDQCKFNDLEGYDETLVPHILKACKLGLIQGFGGKYSPENNLLQAEGLTVAMRAVEGIMDETRNPRWMEYYMAASQLEVVNLQGPWELDQDADRITIGLRLYRTTHAIQERERNTPTKGS